MHIDTFDSMSVAAPFATAPVDPTQALQAQLTPDFARLQSAPAWFQKRVQSAWEEFQALPFPGVRDEAWRYSNAKRFALDNLRPAAPAGEADRQQAIAGSTTLDQAAAHFVFLNDELIHATTAGLPSGVICVPFAEALQSHGDILEQYLMKRKVELGGAKFAALHLAHLRAGVVILAPKNAVVKAPIEIFHWSTGENTLTFPHTLIVTGDHAEVTVVDHHRSLRDEATQSIAVADFVAGPGSHITYVNSQELSLQARALHLSSTTVARDGNVRALQIHLGAAFTRSESVSDLAGPGAHSEMLGVSLPTGDQVVDMRTLQNHAAPHATSNLLYKNALYDQSRSIFAGLIRVEKGAKATDAYQKCRNLLNSEEAEACSLPGLEIINDDVKCSHGATNAPISDEELFYLKARGIHDDAARRLISTGFIEDVISKLTNESLVADLDARIEAKLARIS